MTSYVIGWNQCADFGIATPILTSVRVRRTKIVKLD